jgi:hypothetical protein
MGAAEYFLQNFNILKQRYAGLTKEIHIVTQDIMSSDENLLDACGVRYDTKMVFDDPSIDEIQQSDYGRKELGGLTIGFVRDGTHHSAIFINNDVAKESESDKAMWLWRYNALHHELMHALDISKQKNFNTTNMTMDLVAAEAFADIKTLKHLNASRHPFMGVALKQYANNILTVRDKGPIRARIFDRIIKNISYETLKYWTSDQFYETLLNER